MPHKYNHAALFGSFGQMYVIGSSIKIKRFSTLSQLAVVTWSPDVEICEIVSLDSSNLVKVIFNLARSTAAVCHIAALLMSRL